ncbi:NAD(P)H-quinone oxidoreductase subunit M, partial [Clostridiaceae bacterium UIB06]|nr:NAD(P)H-quinone oxidoreductase subunit M [Clostridiaceae bacterium UIB06]
MGLEQHLTEKISNVLSDLDLSYEVIDSFKEYVEESLEEEELFKKLPIIDMKQLKPETVEAIVSAYHSLTKHKADDYLSKFLRILFQMGKASLFSVLDRTCYYKGASYYRDFLKYGLSPAFVVAYYATSITEQERTLSRDFILFYDGLYEKYKDSFSEAIEISKINEQAIIITYLAYKEETKEHFEWLEKDMLESVKNLFNNSISEMQVEALTEYLKEETSTLEEIVETLKSDSRLVLNLDKYVFRFLVGVSTTICAKSEMARRFIKFAATFDYKEFFHALHNYLKYNRYNVISKLVDMLQIKREWYIAWLGESNKLSYDYTFEKELKEEVDKNREEFKKAISMCFGMNKAYMAFLLWQKGEGKEFLNDVEDVFIH